MTAVAVMTAFNPLSATGYLTSAGALAVLLVIFAETGLLVGLFLPGDSLLFTAGLLCATTVNGTHLSLFTVLPAAALGALLGAEVGWLIGRHAGPTPLSTRHRTLSRGIIRATGIVERYEVGRALALARFIPVVRTVINPLAGLSRGFGGAVRGLELRRRSSMGCRRHPARLRARQPYPQHQYHSAADHRGRRRHLPDPDRCRVPP